MDRTEDKINKTEWERPNNLLGFTCDVYEIYNDFFENMWNINVKEYIWHEIEWRACIKNWKDWIEDERSRGQ